MKKIFFIFAAFIAITSSCDNQYKEIKEHIESKHEFDRAYFAQVLTCEYPINILYDKKLWNYATLYSSLKKERDEAQDVGNKLRRENMGKQKAMNAGYMGVYTIPESYIREAEKNGRERAGYLNSQMDSVKTEVSNHISEILIGSIPIDSICNGWVLYTAYADKEMERMNCYRGSVSLYNRDFSINSKIYLGLEELSSMNEILPNYKRIIGHTIYYVGDKSKYIGMQKFGMIE